MDLRELFIEYVHDRDVSCPRCRYNLRSTDEPRCPECGASFTLSIKVEHADLGAWALLFGATALTGVFGAVLVGLWVYEGRFPYSGGGDWGRYAVGVMMICVPASISVYLMRERFLRLRYVVQGMICALAVALLIAVYVYLVLSLEV